MGLVTHAAGSLSMVTRCSRPSARRSSASSCQQTAWGRLLVSKAAGGASCGASGLRGGQRPAFSGRLIEPVKKHSSCARWICHSAGQSGCGRVPRTAACVKSSTTSQNQCPISRPAAGLSLTRISCFSASTLSSATPFSSSSKSSHRTVRQHAMGPRQGLLGLSSLGDHAAEALIRDNAPQPRPHRGERPFDFADHDVFGVKPNVLGRVGPCHCDCHAELCVRTQARADPPPLPPPCAPPCR